VVPAPPPEKERKDWREFLEDPVGNIPMAVKDSTSAIVERIVGPVSDSPGYFDVVFGSIDIMQDLITRSRMAGEPPDIMLAPRANGIGLLDFDRSGEAIEEGYRCVRRMLPVLKEAVSMLHPAP
jgi:NTE family protein